MSFKRLFEHIVIFSVFVSILLGVIEFNTLYSKVLFRGYIETTMWLERLNNGYSVSSYYYVIDYLMKEFDISLPLTVNILGTLTLLIIAIKFNIFKSRIGFVYYFLIINLFTILLIYSPGRTSLTILLVFFIYNFSIPKVKILPFCFFSLLLIILHPPTFVIVSMFLLYRNVIIFITEKINGFYIKFVIYMFLYFFIATVFYGVIKIGTSYATVVADSGVSFEILLIIGLVISVFILSNKNYFILLVFFSVVFFVILGLNVSYSYRVVYIPVVLGIYMEELYLKKAKYDI